MLTAQQLGKFSTAKMRTALRNPWKECHTGRANEEEIALAKK